MKITGNRPPEGKDPNLAIQRAAKSQGKDQELKTAKTRPEDKVEISGKAREIAELLASVNQLPDVRTDKIAEVKKAVDTGTYNVDPAKVAGKILQEI